MYILWRRVFGISSVAYAGIKFKTFYNPHRNVLLIYFEYKFNRSIIVFRWSFDIHNHKSAAKLVRVVNILYIYIYNIIFKHFMFLSIIIALQTTVRKLYFYIFQLNYILCNYDICIVWYMYWFKWLSFKSMHILLFQFTYRVNKFILIVTLIRS